ncbi:uroporphyrinogen-III C-methyltransferase [Granulicatella sp. 19428wC4_WM01]|nr:uroporphyrinogen-III C-methyltransferase [Granulicatella sp. 19428wC4_WM01]TFU96519.1 uroporphyrinogen-III C-methyltransferase [Granulicatella sp. WM01]
MTGFVTLLGAGPGDEELLTLKGLERIKEADVIVYDRLVNQALLRFAKVECELINVGKIPGQACVSQNDIETILIDKAKEGKRVVRLKSGDPYIFGRGGEEGVALHAQHIPFEVVPGVTSAIAGLTYAGIPATYRDIATSVHVITGHLQDASEELNWQAISQLKGTLIFLMGMKNLPTIVKELMAHGHEASEPIALVEWGTHDKQRSIAGRLDNIVELVQEHRFSSPSIIVVGKVVEFKEVLNFHEHAHLFGKRICVQDSSTGKLPRLLKENGAHLVTFPARDKCVEKPWALPDFTQLEGIVVTDSHAWQFLMEKLVDAGKDIRDLAHLKCVVVGHHTVKALRQNGIKPFETLAQWEVGRLNEVMNHSNKWVILCEETRLAHYSEHFSKELFIETHKLIMSKRIDVENLQCGVDVVCLPNSLAAETFVGVYQEYKMEHLKHVPIVIMGQSTQDVLQRAGFNNMVITEHATIKSMVDATIALIKGE